MKSHLRFGDALGVGSLGLRARPARTLLTAVGIAIGIAAMVAVTGISASSRAELLAKIDQLGTNFLVVGPGQGIAQDAELREFAEPMISRIGPVLSTAAIYPVDATVRRTEFIPRAQTGGISVYAADVDALVPLEAQLIEGRFLDDALAQVPAVVLGSSTARQLDVTDLAVSAVVHLSGTDFAVVGILAPVELVPELDRSALIGLPVAKKLYETEAIPSEIYVRTDPARLDSVRDVIPLTANPEAPNEVSVSRPSDALRAQAAVDTTFTSLLLGLGAVALLVGGVGIANVMVISVLERTAEIGVRRALGATRRHIAVQFVVESALLALLGGLGGVVLGAAITIGYAKTQGWQVDVPMQWLAAGVGVALVIGALAGLYPAARAARLDPAEAVRPS